MSNPVEIASLADHYHQHCFACAEDHPLGLHLKFKEKSDQENQLLGKIKISKSYQGYNGLIHGGIVSTILDSAMTSLLLEKGIVAVTAELNIRFKRVILPEIETIIEAELLEEQPPIYRLEARVMQNGVLSAFAKARFFKPASVSDFLKPE